MHRDTIFIDRALLEMAADATSEWFSSNHDTPQEVSIRVAAKSPRDGLTRFALIYQRPEALALFSVAITEILIETYGSAQGGAMAMSLMGNIDADGLALTEPGGRKSVLLATFPGWAIQA